MIRTSTHKAMQIENRLLLFICLCICFGWYNIVEYFFIPTMARMIKIPSNTSKSVTNDTLNKQHDSGKRLTRESRSMFICTRDEADWVAAQEPIANSNCPDQHEWMSDLIHTSRTRPEATLVSIGCNRGDDLVANMRMWSRNSSYTLIPVESHYSAHSVGPRVCSRPLGSETTLENPIPASGYCVEAMKSTFSFVKNMIALQKWDSQITVIHAAVSAMSGTALFPVADIGYEALGLGHTTSEMTPVRVVTVDDLVFENGISGDIDVMSIDTEGNDANVIIGAVKTLPRVRLLEFEYHNTNSWGQADLQGMINLLHQFSFDCFWQGNQGQLWWLTGCWHDSYYSKRFWSNIMCVNRNEASLHDVLVQRALPRRDMK